MKTLSIATISTLLLSSSVYAQEETPKNWQVGFGLYNTTISYDEGADDEFSGGAIVGTYAHSNNLAFRGSIFSLDHDDLSEVESSGFDLVVYGGTGLLLQGFKIYGGVGIFKDSWEFRGFDESFNGFQLSGGLGYNWEQVAVDYTIGIRDVSDYDDLVSEAGFEAEATVSSNLSISFRF